MRAALHSLTPRAYLKFDAPVTYGGPVHGETSLEMLRGLACEVGATRVAVPTDHVDQIIEYELCSPLPLAKRWIGGLGIWERRVLASIALDAPASAQQPRRRKAKGVLLRQPQWDIEWALEISAVAGFVEVKLQPATSKSAGPPFLRRAASADGRPIAWLDVPLLFATLPLTSSD